METPKTLPMTKLPKAVCIDPARHPCAEYRPANNGDGDCAICFYSESDHPHAQSPRTQKEDF